jgi:heat shock protein HslJ
VDALVGRWVAVGGAGSGAPTLPFVELAADGTYTGSDGCNRTRGPWSAGPDGTLDAGPGPSTRMACPDMVPVPSWFTLAARVRFDAAELVLLDASGTELGRVVRDR